MPTHPFQTNFTSGELTERLDARVNLDKYQNGARCILNASPTPHGGASRRAGTYFVAKAKTTATRVRLIPFRFNVANAYILEFGVGYIRFFHDRAPILNASTTPSIALTLSATSGAGVTVTAGSAVFASTDIGRTITVGSAQGVIVGFTSTTVVTINVWVAFAGLTLGSGTWTFSGVPYEVVSPYTEGELRELRYAQMNDVMYVAHGAHPLYKLSRAGETNWAFAEVNLEPPPSEELAVLGSGQITLSGTSGTITITAATSGTWLAADVNSLVMAGTGRAIITTVTSGTVVSARVLDPFDTTVYADGLWERLGSPYADMTLTFPTSSGNIYGSQVTLTLSIAGWRSSDVGKFVKVLGGTIELTGFTSSTVMTGTILVPPTTLPSPGDTTPEDWSGLSTGNILAGAWTLDTESFSASEGYAEALCFFEQRLWLTKDQTLYGSVSGDFENFAAGANDDDSVIYVIAANELNTIRWIAGMSHLLMGTVVQEFQATGGVEKALTPTNVRVRPVGKRGSDYTVDKLFVETQILFLQRGAAKLRELSYTWQEESYKAPDLSILSEHLFRAGIVEMAHAATPDSILLLVRRDGVLVTCAYEREENIVGWAHQETDGDYESVAVIPNSLCSGAQDEIWVATARTIEDASVRWIEVFDGAYMTDGARAYTGDPVTEVVGLEHLEGEAVDVVADGAAVSATVDGGRIELSVAAETVEVGLPYDTTVVTLRPEFPVQDGTAQARAKSWHELVVRFWCTQGAPLINGEAVTLDSSPFTGDAHRHNLGWNNEGRITVQQLDPLPMTILGVTGDINIADD